MLGHLLGRCWASRFNPNKATALRWTPLAVCLYLSCQIGSGLANVVAASSTHFFVAPLFFSLAISFVCWLCWGDFLLTSPEPPEHFQALFDPVGVVEFEDC